MLCEDWCTVEDVIGVSDSGSATCGPCAPKEGDPPLDEALIADAISLASEVLYGLTGEQFGGLCEQTFRPCARRRCWAGRRRVWNQPTGSAFNGASCACPLERPCGCARLHRVELPAWPVAAVLQVLVDGVELDPSAYRVDEERWLVRLDGDGWPVCQDLEAAGDQPDTFQVTVTAGVERPPGGRIAAAKYACELARSWCGQECDLPGRVTAVTRQGVTYSFDSSARLVAEGRVGLASVDAWVRSVNGGDGQLQAPALIASPDDYRRSWRTGG